MFIRAYYDKLTGNGLVWYALTSGMYQIPTFEEDYATYIELSKRNADTIGWIDFTNGEYYQDFVQSNGCFRVVNPETKELEFSYPDPNTTEPQEPVYQKPLTEQIDELKTKNQELKEELAQTNALILEFMESMMIQGE